MSELVREGRNPHVPTLVADHHRVLAQGDGQAETHLGIRLLQGNERQQGPFRRGLPVASLGERRVEIPKGCALRWNPERLETYAGLPLENSARLAQEMLDPLPTEAAPIHHPHGHGSSGTRILGRETDEEPVSQALIAARNRVERGLRQGPGRASVKSLDPVFEDEAAGAVHTVMDPRETLRLIEAVPDSPHEKEAECRVLVLDPDKLLERADDYEIQIARSRALCRALIAYIDCSNFGESPGAGQCRDGIAADRVCDRPDERCVSRLMLAAPHEPVPVNAKRRAADLAVGPGPRVGNLPDPYTGPARRHIGGNLIQEVWIGPRRLDQRRAGREQERGQEKPEASALSFPHPAEDA
jgi:hypothetical protein